jgi:hypothetical protein
MSKGVADGFDLRVVQGEVETDNGMDEASAELHQHIRGQIAGVLAEGGLKVFPIFLRPQEHRTEDGGIQEVLVGRRL